MTKAPQFKLALAPRPSPHMLETKPRYDVLVNGVKHDELYFNMTGYRGGLPDIRGYKLDIGEASISAYRREVATLNREAHALLAQALSDPKVVLSTYGATERDKVLICVGTPPLDEGDDPLEMRSVFRRDWEAARIFFGHDRIPSSFLLEADIADMEVEEVEGLEFDEGDKVLAALDTEDHSFVCLAVGQLPSAGPKRPMSVLDPSQVEANTSNFVWLTRMAWRQLVARAGRELVDAKDLPLVAQRTLSPGTRPMLTSTPRNEWALEKMSRSSAPEPTCPTF